MAVKVPNLTSRVLAIIVAVTCSGCQHTAQQAIDPFWGRTTVPAPATGSIGAPAVGQGYPQPLQPPIVTQGTLIPGGGLQATPPPNLLPAPMSPMPAAPATVTPAPASTAPTGNGSPYGNGTPAMTPPPSGYPTPSRAPLSGYSNSDSSSSGTATPPAATSPGSTPAGAYPSWPPSSTAPGGPAPSTSGTLPSVPSSSSPANPAPAAAPTGSSPSNGTRAPDYFPPDGDYRYHGSTQASPGQVNWLTASRVAVSAANHGGATMATTAGTTAGGGLDAGPSIVRIPATTEGDSIATPASAENR